MKKLYIIAAVVSLAVSGLFVFLANAADAHTDTITGQSVCNADAGTQLVTFTINVTNVPTDHGGMPGDFTLSSTSGTPSLSSDVFDGDGSFTVTESVPGTATSANLKAVVTWPAFFNDGAFGPITTNFSFSLPGNCTTAVTTTTTTTTQPTTTTTTQPTTTTTGPTVTTTSVPPTTVPPTTPTTTPAVPPTTPTTLVNPQDELKQLQIAPGVTAGKE